MQLNGKQQLHRWIVTTLALAGLSSLPAQTTGPEAGAFRHGGNVGFIAHEMASQPVKGAPFAADAVIQTTQTLANGTHITRNSTAAMYRDSEGRTRREETLGAVGPLASSGGASRQMVFIHDPVAAAAYVLNPQNHTARKMAFNPGHGGRGSQAASGGAGQDAMASAVAGPAARRAQRFGGAVKTESLGKQVIEGIEVEGTRHTVTIPAGAMGNDQAMQSVTERWYSADLQVVVKSVHTDPRFGQTVYQLTNIRRGEQPSPLFEVPADYTTTTGGRGSKATQ
jgi:hypothetical protein